MRKFIGIIAALLLLSSCGGNNQENYDICFVDISEEDQKLFKEEIGVNQELCLGVLSSDFKISQIIPVTVCAVSEPEDGSANAGWDWAMVKNAYSLLLQMDIDKFVDQCAYDTAMNNSAVGCAIDLDEENILPYLYFPGDQRSFSTFPIKRSALMQLIKGNGTNEMFAGKTETDQLVTASVLLIRQCVIPQTMTAFNCQLSNGKTFRVFFLAEKK